VNDTQVLSGKWTVGHEQEAFDGNLHVNENERFITLEILIPMMQERKTTTFPHRGKIPFITGTLLTGAKVLLYDCETGAAHHQVPLFTRIYIYAKYAFWGLSADCFAQPLFKGASVDFGDILNWYDLCRYEDVGLKEGEKHGYTWNSEKPITIQANDNLTISFAPAAHGYLGEIYKREFTLKQTVWVRLEYKNEVSWEAILQDIKKLQYLIGLAATQMIEIEELKFTHRSIFTVLPDRQGERYYNESDVILGTGKTAHNQQRPTHQYIFRLKDFLSMENRMSTWWEKYEKLEPILDLYFSAYKQSGTAVTVFLSLMQALETFHARFITNSLTAYKERANELVAKYEVESIKKQWKDFLLNDSQNAEDATYIYLRSRLADLLYADGDLPLRIGFGFCPTEALNKLCNSRNYYTHYDEGNKKKAYPAEKLPTVNSYLSCLLNYHILLLIGFESPAIRQKIDEEVKSLKTYEDIHKAFEKA